MALFDTSTEFGARVQRRLEDEQTIWLTTTGKDGTPQPSPVWFLWDGEEVLIYSQPNTGKLKGIERNARVALNFNGTEYGADIVILSGSARIVADEQPSNKNAAYAKKYDSGIKSIEMTQQSFADSYSVAVRVSLDKLRGW